MSTFSCWAGISARIWGAPEPKRFDKRPKHTSSHTRSIKELSPTEKLAEILKIENPGSSKKLRSFWAAFAAFDFQSFQHDKPDRESENLEVLLSRCVQATYPFLLALRLLLGDAGEKKTLRAVQKNLGRADLLAAAFAEPDYDEVESQMERYMSHARAFQLMGALLQRERRPARGLEEKFELLIAAQRLVPQEWRSA